MPNGFGTIGGGVGRIFQKPSRPANIENHYVVGSGVGAKSRAVRKALKRRANNNAQGKPCCAQHKPIVNYCQLPPPKKNQTIQHINQSNIDLLSQNTPHPNVYYVITEPVYSTVPLVVDPTSTLCISSAGSLDLSPTPSSKIKLSANDIYNCGTITFGNISGGGGGGNVGLVAFNSDGLTLTNNGTITFGNISGANGGAGIVGFPHSLTLTNNGTITFGNISGANGGAGIVGSTLTLTNNGTITFGNISGSGGQDQSYGFLAGSLYVKQKGRICVKSLEQFGFLGNAPPLNTPSCN